MKSYVGMDISNEETSVCVLDEEGRLAFEGRVATNPEAISKILHKRCPAAERIVFESGALSNWLWHELKVLGFPVVCLDARYAHAALSMRINKTDRNDARGLAEIGRLGWYRQVAVKSIENRELRGALAARGKLVELRRDLENQIRGLCKSLGILIGRAGSQTLAAKMQALLRNNADMRALFDPLLEAQVCLSRQIERFDQQLTSLAKEDCDVRRMMTVPGVGPITALTFKATIDDPKRFKSSADVGAYLGLTPRRYQSGEINVMGRISKRGNALARTYLYEAASVLLTVVKRGSVLKTWGTNLLRRAGPKKAKVAVARKLSVILYCIWTGGIDFEPTGRKVHL